MARMTMFQIPTTFATMIADREGPAGVEWLRLLPATVEALLNTWHLSPDGLPLHGMCAVVLPVRTADDVPAMLKVGLMDEETRLEPKVMRAWEGRGAAGVLRTDEERGVMLLERLDATRVLTDVPLQEALDVSAALLRRLRVPAIQGLRAASETARRWSTELLDDWRRLGEPCDEGLLGSALETCEELSTPVAAPSILHGDFHYANILERDEGEWAVIDPKPLAGDPAYEVVPLLRNRWSEIRGGGATVADVEHRMLRFADLAELDLPAVYQWGLIRSVDDAMWFQENGHQESAYTSWDIARCMAELR